MIQTEQKRIALPTGVTLNVHFAGTGADVLLLHGITGCGLYWSVQMANLVAAGYRVIAPDGRGHGTSDRTADYATASIAEDAAALITELGLHKPTIIGHSMGGAQSLYLASEHPELVGRLILEDPAVWPQGGDDAYVAGVRDPWKQGLQAWVGLSQEALIAFKQNEAPHWSAEALDSWATAKRQNDPEVLAWLDEIKTPVWQWLNKVTVPITVLYCEPERGGVVGAAFAQELVGYMPHLNAVCIPGVGHEMHHDNPEAFISAVWDAMS
jgi:pimeloyl-ACP methyl ester carboxylesterase